MIMMKSLNPDAEGQNLMASKTNFQQSRSNMMMEQGYNLAGSSSLNKPIGPQYHGGASMLGLGFSSQ
jgi:hypothetical protein